MNKSPTTLVSSSSAVSDILHTGKCIARYNFSSTSSTPSSPRNNAQNFDRFVLPAEVLKSLFMMLINKSSCVLSIYRLGKLLFADIGPEEALRFLGSSENLNDRGYPSSRHRFAITENEIDAIRDLVSKNIVMPRNVEESASAIIPKRSRSNSEECIKPRTNPFCPHSSSFIASGVPISDLLDRKLLTWQTMDGTEVLVGSKSIVHLLCDGGPQVTVRSHNLHDGNIGLSTLVDWYVENLIANVPQLALVLHQDGIVRNFRLIPTDKISHLKIDASGDVKVEDDDVCDGVFDHSSLVIQASLLLKFLKERCVRDDGTYLLCKDKGNDGGEYSVIDLNCTAEESRQKKWIWLLSMLNYRTAQRIGEYVALKTRQRLQDVCQTSVLVERQQRLLRNALELLTQLRDMGLHYHSTISAAVCELLSDTHWNTATDLRTKGSKLKSVLWELEQAEEALLIGMKQLDVAQEGDANDQSDESVVHDSKLTLMTALVHKQIGVCRLHIKSLYNRRVNLIDSRHEQDDDVDVTFDRPSGYYSSILSGLEKMRIGLDHWVKLASLSAHSNGNDEDENDGRSSGAFRMQVSALLLQMSNIWELCRNTLLSLIDELSNDNRFNWPCELDSGLYIEKIVDLMQTVDRIEREYSTHSPKSSSPSNMRDLLHKGSFLLNCADYSSGLSFESNLSMWKMSIDESVCQMLIRSPTSLPSEVWSGISECINEEKSNEATTELKPCMALQIAFQRNEMILLAAICTDRIRFHTFLATNDTAFRREKLHEFADQCNEVGQSAVCFIRSYYDELSISFKLKGMEISWTWLKLAQSIFALTDDPRNIAIVGLNIVFLCRNIASAIVMNKNARYYHLFDLLLESCHLELSRIREVVLINDAPVTTSKKKLSGLQQDMSNLWEIIDSETANVAMTQGVELKRRLLETPSLLLAESTNLVSQITGTFHRAIEIYDRTKDKKHSAICHYNISMVLMDVWNRRNDHHQTSVNLNQVFAECSSHLSLAEEVLKDDLFYGIAIKFAFSELILGLDPLSCNPHDLKASLISLLCGICSMTIKSSKDGNLESRTSQLLNQVPKLIRTLLKVMQTVNDVDGVNRAKCAWRLIVCEDVCASREKRSADYRNIIGGLNVELLLFRA